MKITIGAGKRSLYDAFPLGQRNGSPLDLLCAAMFAVTPIVQHYYGLYENAGFTLYLLILPIMLLRLGLSGVRLRLRQIAPGVPLILFELYCMLLRIGSLSRVLYSIFFIGFLILLFNGCLNVRAVFRCAAFIGSVGTALLIAQYASYYLLHRPLNLEPHGWLLPENSRWMVEAVYQAGKLYRPSAFFLEPSHFFLYNFPVVALCLLLPGMNTWRMQNAVFISLGIVLSTSGMGIFIVAGLWGIYLLLYRVGRTTPRERLRKLFSVRNVIIFLVLIVALAAAYFTVPMIRRAVGRIFSSDQATNAIAGRIRLAKNYVSQISGIHILIGTVGVNSSLDFNTSGFFATYIRWGVLGLLLSYWHYVQGLFKLKGAYFWLSVLLVLLSFFTAHTHGTFYMMYYTACLANGYCAARRERAGGAIPGLEVFA